MEQMWNKLIDMYVQHYQFHLVLLVTDLSEKYHNTDLHAYKPHLGAIITMTFVRMLASKIKFRVHLGSFCLNSVCSVI